MFNNYPAVVISIVLVLAFIVTLILYYLTQQNTLKAVSVLNRQMSPGKVWLQLIPLFSLYWQFRVNRAICDSLKREFSTSSSNPEDILSVDVLPAPEVDNLYKTGNTLCILFCAGLLPIPLVSWIIQIATISFWVTYWIKLSALKRKVTQLSRLQASPVTL